MTEPQAPPPNEPLMRALVALSARCADSEPRPTVNATREIATEIAVEYDLSSDDCEALQRAAENLAAPLVEPIDDDDSYDHDSLFEPAAHMRPAPAADEPISPTPAGDDSGRPPTRRVSRRTVMLIVATVVAVAITTVAVARLQRSEAGACETAIRRNSDLLAQLAVCKHDYAGSRLPRTGAHTADLLFETEQLPEAAALATELLATPAASDALRVLGKVAFVQGRFDDSLEALESARARHTEEQRPVEIARDELALSVSFRAREQFAAALRVLEMCITTSRQASDVDTEGACHLAMASVLGDLGALPLAHEEQGRAEALLVRDRDVARLALARGALEHQPGFDARSRHDAIVVVALERAVQLANATSDSRLARTAELLLAESLAELGRVDQAEQHLDAVRRRDLGHNDAVAIDVVMARIAFRRGVIATAGSLAAGAYGRLTSAGQRLRVSDLRAEIAMAAGDLDAARMWAARGVDGDELVYGASGRRGGRPRIVPLRRQAYELLFAALVGLRRVEEAIAVFDQLQARTLADSFAGAKLSEPSFDAPAPTRPDPDVLPLALGDVELVAVLVAHEHVWRVTALHGHLDAVDLGPLAALDPLLARFSEAPLQPEASETLGKIVLGEAAFRETREPLFVLLDRPVVGIPVVALRMHGRPIVAMRPILRVSRFSALGCVRTTGRPGGTVILADPRGDLPASRIEAAQVAEGLGGIPAIANAATSDALFAFSPRDLVHIAMRSRNGSLELYDRTVSPAEISRRAHGAALVVLATSSSAISEDGALAASLADAFLTSGSRQVVATLRPVSDAGASEITRAFYAQGGVTDPVGALARIQAELATTGNADWPNFAVFGNDTCAGDPR